MSGLFIAFEGGEGSGKSTQTQIIRSWLEGKGHNVVLTRQPGGTDLGKQLRHILLDLSSKEVAPITEALLFAADRAEHMHRVIHPALAKGDVVICDRYVDSFIAYEKGGRQLDAEEIERLSRWATDSLTPDLTILLDIPPQSGLARRGDLDRMEMQPIEFHQRVRANFLELAASNPNRYLVIDAQQSPQEISAIIKERCVLLLMTR